jgi:hypothetical protein
MTPLTDAELKLKGVGALVKALGEVDAERFITLLNSEPFMYTVWQGEIFPELNVQDISKLAMNLRNNNTK